jgi:hypothetical protein
MRTDQDGSFPDTLHAKETDMHSYLFFTTGCATDLTLTVENNMVVRAGHGSVPVSKFHAACFLQYIIGMLLLKII